MVKALKFHISNQLFS